ncbi:hypothetical protein EDD55_103255 [Varunaivibrio sulfuroxidans]|uniref:Uncharacterized protein n=2 Tax=Varunaivibrio sulfuroxidans TaxID=1773489 RepID=A0A4R3JCX7_9PROT|nr:hypothetical protein EDD55_103255 [Varunaivibrio sulfuroxidans]
MDIKRTVSENLGARPGAHARLGGAPRQTKGAAVPGVQRSSAQPESYQLARDAGARARVFHTPETPQNTASLARLDRILSSGQPLRGDVPRGYYLNIVV